MCVYVRFFILRIKLTCSFSCSADCRTESVVCHSHSDTQVVWGARLQASKRRRDVLVAAADQHSSYAIVRRRPVVLCSASSSAVYRNIVSCWHLIAIYRSPVQIRCHPLTDMSFNHTQLPLCTPTSTGQQAVDDALKLGR